MFSLGAFMIRKAFIGMAVLGTLAVTTLPASAQVAEFFCSTFSIGCEPPPPPPPPPAPIPAVQETTPPPPKHVHHHHKPKPKHTAAPKPDADAAPPAAAQ
jgi:outer membrane biosynthesis protein TonB